jgi:fructokinase
VVKVSEDDLDWLEPGRPWPEAARTLLKRGPAAVLVTRGAQGAAAVTARAHTEVDPLHVEVVDTIGAGDAFGGGFLAWWRARGLGREALGDHELVVEATRFAARVAALTCAKPGASPPRLEEVEVRGS